MPSAAVRVGQFLQGSSADHVLLIFDALRSADSPQIDAPQISFPPLTNGLLLDIYCFIHSQYESVFAGRLDACALPRICSER
jgi:hypothetical protein